MPKRLRGMLADRPAAVAALTKIFLDEIERLLSAAAGVTSGAPTSARPRLGGISFLHRFGSALNHHVHLHACVTDGVFVPAPAQAAGDAPPAFLPARPINQADLAALTERVRRRVIRWFRLARLLDAAAAAESRRGRETLASSLSRRSDSAVVASCGEDGKVVWWDVKDGWPVVNKPDAHPGGVLDCRFGPQGELATCGRDGLVKIWSAEGNEKKKFSVADDTPADARPPAGVALLPMRVIMSADGATVLAGDTAGRLHGWATK